VAADFDVAVAVTAVHAELGNMEFVIESDGLDGLIADARIFGREIIPDRNRDEATDDRQDNSGLDEDQIGSFGENIGHVALGKRVSSPPIDLSITFHAKDNSTVKLALCGYQTPFARATGIVKFFMILSYGNSLRIEFGLIQR
jgi:hypothetical protein